MLVIDGLSVTNREVAGEIVAKSPPENHFEGRSFDCVVSLACPNAFGLGNERSAETEEVARPKWRFRGCSHLILPAVDSIILAGGRFQFGKNRLLELGGRYHYLPSTSTREAKMKYMAALLLVLSIGSCVEAQKLAEYETVNMTILKIERVREEVEGGQWLIVKLTMRDSQGVIYRASSRCIRTNPDSPVSCLHLIVPRVGKTYAARRYLGVEMISFDNGSPGFLGLEIDSEEVSGRAQGK